MEPGCSTATTRPRNNPGMASLLVSALDETCAASMRAGTVVAPNAAPTAPPATFKQLRRVHCIGQSSCGVIGFYSSTSDESLRSILRERQARGLPDAPVQS